MHLNWQYKWTVLLVNWVVCLMTEDVKHIITTLCIVIMTSLTNFSRCTKIINSTRMSEVEKDVIYVKLVTSPYKD